MTQSELESIIQKNGNAESSILSILQDIQAKEKYLPKDTLEYVSEKMRIPLTRIYRIATFYNALSLKPRGRHTIDVCLGTACHVRGGTKIMEKLERDLKVKVGETTKDQRFTLESVRCLGCCSLGPVMVVDEEVYGRVSQDKVSDLLKDFK